MKQKSENDYKQTVVNQFNLIFGLHKNGLKTDYWQYELPNKINEKFIGANVFYVRKYFIFHFL